MEWVVGGSNKINLQKLISLQDTISKLHISNFHRSQNGDICRIDFCWFFSSFSWCSAQFDSYIHNYIYAVTKFREKQPKRRFILNICDQKRKTRDFCQIFWKF